jgi:hypothetical protein
MRHSVLALTALCVFSTNQIICSEAEAPSLDQFVCNLACIAIDEYGKHPELMLAAQRANASYRAANMHIEEKRKHEGCPEEEEKSDDERLIFGTISLTIQVQHLFIGKDRKEQFLAALEKVITLYSHLTKSEHLLQSSEDVKNKEAAIVFHSARQSIACEATSYFLTALVIAEKDTSKDEISRMTKVIEESVTTFPLNFANIPGLQTEEREKELTTLFDAARKLAEKTHITIPPVAVALCPYCGEFTCEDSE